MLGFKKKSYPTQKVEVAFFTINGLKIELVQPLGEDSPVNKLLEEGKSLYHLCFKVPDIIKSIEVARKNGFHCISQPIPSTPFGGRQIVWLFSRTYGLIELLEKDVA